MRQSAKKSQKRVAGLIVNGFPDDPFQDVVDAIPWNGVKLWLFPQMFSDAENAKVFIRKAVEAWCMHDILINNAGSSGTQELHYYPLEVI